MMGLNLMIGSSFIIYIHLCRRWKDIDVISVDQPLLQSYRYEVSIPHTIPFHVQTSIDHGALVASGIKFAAEPKIRK